MACIGKIGASLAMLCGAPTRADLGRPVSAKLINAADIRSFTISSATGEATITRVPTAVGYNVTAINNALVVTVGLKSQDIMPGAYDVSITFKTFSGEFALASAFTPMGSVGVLGRAELVIAVDHGDVVRVYGLGAPLVCTELSGDSSASEYVTYTYGVEDWQVGTTIHNLSRAAYDALSTPAVAPGA
ncbi:hypothetical protein BU183P1_00013 [Bacteroides phage BU183P1]|nr:hypothetical protein BU183P1_00013 [Bacteroides phage BU183P1]WAX10098.1 hypothetical protein BU183P2_00037 [Bacteroides phage BU183P2]